MTIIRSGPGEGGGGGGRGGREKLYWTSSMSVGIEKIDYQHKELFCLVNDLMDLLNDGREPESIELAFDFLQDYVNDHFGEEEKYMDKYSFPGAAPHKEQHAVFKITFENLRRRYDEIGPSEGLMKILQSQLAAWIMTHVKNVDKMLGEYLKDKD
ncbi:MAG: hemerythrin family protein [Thermodesulfobacteriota bacterium]